VLVEPRRVRNFEGALEEMTSVHTEATGSVSLDVHFCQRLIADHRKQKGHQYDECACGFYAYLNGHNEYNHVSRVTGIIEGYGETLIGTRGFRAQKAKILALAPGVRDGHPAIVAAGGFYLPPSMKSLLGLDEDGERAPNMKKVSKAYPEIPVFADVETMRREFPPTDVKEVTG
jgi:hypothetical protein